VVGFGALPGVGLEDDRAARDDAVGEDGSGLSVASIAARNDCITSLLHAPVELADACPGPRGMAHRFRQ
jgi:hypothetical protein